MKDLRDIIEISLQENVDKALEKMDDLQLYKLTQYLAGSFLTKPPNDEQRVFIQEIFGEHRWAEFVNSEQLRRGKNPPYFIKIPPFDFQQIRSIVMFECCKRFGDVLLNISDLKVEIATNKSNTATLKRDLAQAVLDSFDENDTFWKDDGWCNVSDVLQKHELFNLD